jgi:hypothetical protein
MGGIESSIDLTLASMGPSPHVVFPLAFFNDE